MKTRGRMEMNEISRCTCRYKWESPLPIGRRLAPAMLVVAATAMPAQAQVQSIDEYLEQVKAIGEPPFDASRKKLPDYPEYKAKYKRQQHEMYKQKAALLLEACRLHPDDERAAELMERHWVLLGWNQDPADVADEVLADIESVLPTNRNEQVAAHGAYWKAYYGAHKNVENAAAMMRCVEPFVRTHPKDDRGDGLLYLVASDPSADAKLRISIYRRLAEDYPDTHFGKYAPGMIQQIESLGKPFQLSFTDAITGRVVSIAGLRGHVVVLDFWATTCPPCIAEMPQMKELYAKYHGKGVEFIGVSLDEPEERGGLKALRKFVEENEIPWPQYYQGNGYDSEFSKSWGIAGAPRLFIIDKAGRLHSTHVGGKLDVFIPLLLSE